MSDIINVNSTVNTNPTIDCILGNVPEDCDEFRCIEEINCTHCEPYCEQRNDCKKCNFNVAGENKIDLGEDA